MTHRESQRLAYEEIKANGLLSRRRFQVYEIIYNHADDDLGMTSGEVDRQLTRDLQAWTRAASPRLNELEKLGVIEELPEPRECRATGMRVIAYRITGNLPQGKIHQHLKGRRQRLETELRQAGERIAELEAEVTSLRSQAGILPFAP